MALLGVSTINGEYGRINLILTTDMENVLAAASACPVATNAG